MLRFPTFAGPTVSNACYGAMHSESKEENE